MDKPKITIEFCTRCNWLLRSAWIAQELLTTFSLELGEVSLKPGDGGVFRIHLGSTLVFDRKEVGSFPDIKHLKQSIRDLVAPDRSLGHSDANV